MLNDPVILNEIKPVLVGYIREAQFMLDPVEIPDDKTIHDLRVLMKKARASIKLLKSQVENEFLEKEYAAFREVGRRTRMWRDTSVQRKLLKDLKKRYPELMMQLQTNEKIKMLTDSQVNEELPAEETKKDVTAIIDLLHKSEYRLRFRSVKDIDPYLMLKEIEQTFNCVMACYLKSRNYPKGNNIHELRKKVKDFLYQLPYFRPLNPKAIKGLEKELDSIARNTGKFNDNSVLIEKLGYKYSPGENDPAMDELIILIKQDQDRHLSKVWPSAYKIFRPGQRLGNVPGFRTITI